MLVGAEPEQRLPGSLAAAVAAALAGADIVRVHDVAATRQAIDVINALRKFK
jgi:dihydropteroate synthase